MSDSEERNTRKSKDKPLDLAPTTNSNHLKKRDFIAKILCPESERGALNIRRRKVLKVNVEHSTLDAVKESETDVSSVGPWSE